MAAPGTACLAACSATTRAKSPLTMEPRWHRFRDGRRRARAVLGMLPRRARSLRVGLTCGSVAQP